MEYNAAAPIYLQVKKEMAGELLDSFMREMSGLGFEKKDIISQIEDYKEEEEK